MSHFKNILVAFDGSLDSIHALKAAETLAKDNQAHLTVAYVHDRSPEGSANGTTSPKDILSQTYVGPGPAPTRTIHRHMNDKRRNKWMNTPDQVISSAKNTISSRISVKYEILMGNPANQLRLYAKDNKKDLIVIGNRGMNGFKKTVMGSGSRKVTNQADCAVLVIK